MFFFLKILDVREQFHQVCVQFLNWTRERNLAILSTGCLKINASTRKYTRLVFLSASNSYNTERKTRPLLVTCKQSIYRTWNCAIHTRKRIRGWSSVVCSFHIKCCILYFSSLRLKREDEVDEYPNIYISVYVHNIYPFVFTIKRNTKATHVKLWQKALMFGDIYVLY